MTDDSPTPDLARLAEAHGIATEYWSFFGDRVQVPAPTLRAVLTAMHVDTSTDAAVAAIRRIELFRKHYVILMRYDHPAAEALDLDGRHGQCRGGKDQPVQQYQRPGVGGVVVCHRFIPDRRNPTFHADPGHRARCSAPAAGI